MIAMPRRTLLEGAPRMSMQRLLDPRCSIVARLTLTLALIAVAVFAATGALLYWTLERELMRVEFAEVQNRIELVQRLLQESGEAGVDDEFRRKLDDVMAGHGNLLVWIHARDGRLLFASAPEPVGSFGSTGSSEAPSMFTLADGSTTAGCRVTVKEPGMAEGAKVTVALGVSMRGHVLGMYRNTVAWICALGFLATVVLAAVATRRGFRPVRRLAEQAARITPETLSLRLPPGGDDHELQALAASFNDALARLQQSHARLEAFNADVAHELRTPLAALISGIEVTLAMERPKAELAQLHATNLELLRRLGAIVGDMLFLARADVGEQAGDREQVSLAAEAGKVIEYYDGLLAEAGVSVALHGDAQVRCNRGLVRRAVSNLLSNALKYSSGTPPAPITVEIGQTEREVTLSVRNHGPTIARRDLPRLFDRFYRGEPSRSARDASHGLGLAIVRAIASMHGGSVDARSDDGITVVGFRLAK